jgi:ribosome-associated heat shock protein Hsp15
MSRNEQNSLDSMRLDKWLFYARFYKTRSRSATAIKNGRIKIAGQKLKAARLVRVGDELEITLKPYRFEIIVNAVAKSRRSAKDATILYAESAESIENREKLAIQLMNDAGSRPLSAARPDKKQRRKIVRFTRSAD